MLTSNLLRAKTWKGEIRPDYIAVDDQDLLGLAETLIESFQSHLGKPRHELETELKELLGVTGVPDFVRIARWNRAMPQYHVGHLERIEEIERRVKLLPGLALAGNAYRGVGVPDCIHSGELAAESVMQKGEH